MKLGVCLSAFVGLVALAGCSVNHTTNNNVSAPESVVSSPSASVQQVSDETVCDLLFADGGAVARSAGLMSQRLSTERAAREARRYASALDRIRAHARPVMAAKVAALSQALRDYADWVGSPTSSFSGEAYAVAGLELGNTCGLRLPLGGSVPDALGVPTQDATQHLTYFDVSVNSHLGGEGFWATNVTVCYRSPHPDANADGTTRVSTDPWSVLVQTPDGGLRATPVSELPRTNFGLNPQYSETLLSPGQCQMGWITVIPSGGGRFAGVKYAPRDFPTDTVTWRW